MNESMRAILVDALYLIALINPISKISVLMAYSTVPRRSEFHRIVIKSSMVAAGILLVSMIAGDFVLRVVFHVDLHSLRVAGGMVLFWVGFNALRKGVFFEQDTHARFADIAVVPLACPMIAGPATITACITLTAQHGYVFPISAMLIAIGVNTALMLFAKRIGELLKRFDILGALIRLTGLVVMTMGVQMIFDGLEQWVSLLRK